ncbi:3'-5' exonuclease [Paenalcaligenes niemegkensis]|uniref:3'-5' exonuclease n=1 Tax=Paenalcaligenes niemegkensis TaxID=2895469 RepID=UPI001EE831E3|nr:3'-5' exonuclease [Paenalcaligenes niemegkensis]MCQ9615997.1 3'-5' exonuclease [Paenalcaligenes niemegkensis]
MSLFNRIRKRWFDDTGPDCVGLESEPWLNARDVELHTTPYLVVDLETDGLDLRKNRILSVGAVRVSNRQLSYSSSFYRILRHGGRLRGDSLLIHGLMPSELAKGDVAANVLRSLCHWGKECVWIGFHAGFDAQLLQNAFKQELKWRVRPNMVNIAEFLPMLVHDVADNENTLEYWASHFKLDPMGRHNALGDATITAELLLIVLAKARAADISTWADLYARHKSWAQVRQHLSPVF